MMKRLILATLLVGTAALASSEAEARTNRDEAIEAVQLDGMTRRIDGKEMKLLKKNYPVMYKKLKNFCKTAKKGKEPGNVGVTIPAGSPKMANDCKGKHVSKPFLNAWAEKGKDIGGDAPPPAASPSKPGDVDRSKHDSGAPARNR